MKTCAFTNCSRVVVCSKYCKFHWRIVKQTELKRLLQHKSLMQEVEVKV
jgi:hypothetical protein